MPVTCNQLTPANAGLPGYAIAKALAIQAVHQFNSVRPAHVGIGPASCCASVAVNPSAHFPAVAGTPFGVAFGNSQIAAGGLDQGPLGGHAERCALTAANNNGLALYAPAANSAVLFVELEPCGGCATWLLGGGGGLANPYHFGAGGTTLHVWYAFPYTPAGIGAMTAFHGTALAAQLAAAAGW